MATIDEAIEANRAAFLELTTRTGAVVADRDGLCLYFRLHPSWVIVNGAFRTDPALAPEATIERTTEAFWARRRRPVMTTFGPADDDLERALTAASWVPVIDLPVMVRATPLPTPAAGPGVHVRWLDAGVEQDLAALRSVLRRGFAESDEEQEVVDSVFAKAASISLPGAAAVAVERDGAAAAVAVVYRLGEAAVVGWVATVPEARRQGLGRLATAAATNRGLDLGAAWATLQASPMGAPLYRAMGFETLTSSRIWLAPEPEA